MNESKVLGPVPDWEEHEKPAMPGSPASLDHCVPVRIAYACVALLIGLTGGLGAGLLAANLPAIQGQLGLTPGQGAWLAAAYVMVNITANLLVFKFRQQYGIRLFAELGLSLYAAVTLLHLFVQGFEMTVTVRAVSGFVSAATSTLAVLYMLQAFPKTKLAAGLVVGMTIAQLATPLAWLLSPAMLDLGDWRTWYQFEAGLALCSLAAVVLLKLPLGIRVQVLERLDFLTFALVAPGVALLAAVLVQGLNAWWFDSEWLAWALIASLLLLTAAGIVEYRRKTPLLQVRWLFDVTTLRFILGALMMRFLLSEQTYGAVGLLRTLGMGPDQLQLLYAVMLVGMVCGMAVSALTFGQKTIRLQILLSIVLIAIGGWLDHQSTSLSRPHDFYLSQFLLSFASAMFMGPLLMIGIMQALKFGADHMITFMVLFAMTQSLGGLLGPTLLGTLQAERTQAYVQAIGSHLEAGNPAVAQRLAQLQGALAGVLADPGARAAQAAAQLNRLVRREASVRAFNDVFAVIGVLALAFLAWSLYRIRRAALDTRRIASAASAPVSRGSAGVAAVRSNPSMNQNSPPRPAAASPEAPEPSPQALADGANAPARAPAPASASSDQAAAFSAAPAKTVKPSRFAVVAMLFVAFAGVLMILWSWRLGPFATSTVRTDNAYVRGQITVLAPQISGYVREVLVRDFERVEAGQPLVRIDDRIAAEKVHAAQAQLENAQAQLANAAQTQAQNRADLGARRASLVAVQAEARRAQADLGRANQLAEKGSVSLRERDQARATSELALANVRKAGADIDIGQQAIKSTTVSRAGLQAQVKSAEAQLALAKIDLANTVVHAPRDGQLGEASVRLGQYVTAGSQLLFLVPDSLWVVANFKETQTAHMRVGQPAYFKVDALQDAALRGHIQEMAAATGSEFSVLRAAC